jgi:protoheme IX farnesyltransferase
MSADTNVLPEAVAATHPTLADYVELTKPRVALLVLFTVAAGAWLATGRLPDLALLFHTLAGTALVAGGASALNQLLERRSDALMQRTENRPLPTGRLLPAEVLAFGFLLGITGVAYLAIALPRPLAAGVAAVAFLSYAFVYTPLKRKTTFNTLVGAIPGALPPVIGWTAVGGSLGREVLVLFVILFLWQVPHFLAIAWIHREDYARAGLRMLTVVDSRGKMTGRQMVSYCLALLPVSLLPAVMGQVGPLYIVGAMALGIGFLGSAIGFTRATSVSQARRVLRASLIYLPALLALLLADGMSTQVALALWR